jgi:hypothetical protein
VSGTTFGWPLCCFGSVEDSQNYRHLSALSHIMVHTALCYFFPFINSLNLALDFLIHSRTKNNCGLLRRVSKEELDDTLEGTGLSAVRSPQSAVCSPQSAVQAQAKEASNKAVSEWRKGKECKKKPPSNDPKANKNRFLSKKSTAR